MTHFLSSQQDQSWHGDSEKGPTWTWYQITHLLSCQQDHSASGDSERGPSCTCHQITYFLSSQQDQSNNVPVRRVPDGPGIKSPTICQANRIRMEVGTLRGPSCTQHQTTHPLSSQQDQSGSRDSENGPRWTSWHHITHLLSSQQAQSGSGDSEKGPRWT